MYYSLEDVDLDGRMFLGNLYDGTGAELDSRDFTCGIPFKTPLKVHLWNSEELVEIQHPMRFSLYQSGRPLEFTFNVSSVPVVSSRIADLISKMAAVDIQRVPVLIDPDLGGYEIINLVSRVPCIDTKASRIMWWTEADGRPDKVGQPQMITKLAIDPDRVGGHDIFRLQSWEGPLIVSERLKRALEAERVTGVTFQSL